MFTRIEFTKTSMLSPCWSSPQLRGSRRSSRGNLQGKLLSRAGERPRAGTTTYSVLRLPSCGLTPEWSPPEGMRLFLPGQFNADPGSAAVVCSTTVLDSPSINTLALRASPFIWGPHRGRSPTLLPATVGDINRIRPRSARMQPDEASEPLQLGHRFACPFTCRKDPVVRVPVPVL